jgi:LmbE family N-acetylglucosaminyl deacetylase
MSTLVVVAHPDDEVLGAGIWMHRRSGHLTYILHLTDGSPRDLRDARAAGFATRESYAATRRAELERALKLIPIPYASCIQFCFPDKEACLNLPDLVAQLESLIEWLKPSLVVSHAYEGGHPDHDAAAFAVAAVRERRESFRHLEFPLYHAGPKGEMVTGKFLAAATPIAEEVIALSPSDRTLKSKMLACFRTQGEMLSRFALGTERFREAPAYDFTKAPHPGQLLYERWGLGITGEEWRARVEQYRHVQQLQRT